MASKAYFEAMNITVKEAETRFAELLRRAEAGETITITRDGEPVVDLVEHEGRKGGLNFEALRAYKKLHGITKFVESIPVDFDDPLPEDFLLRPLP